MSVYSGPNVSDNGLVFAYDMYNSNKSWKGKPTTNLINNPDFKNMVSGLTGWSIVDATSISAEPAVYLGRPCIKLTRQPNNAGYDGITNTALNRVANTTYTETISYAIPYTMTQSLRFYLPERTDGVVTNYRNYLTVLNATNGWTTHTVTYTTSATANSWDGYRIDWNTTASTQVETCYIEYIQVEEGTFSTPWLTGTRSNTQALLDQTNRNIITANSLTYSSDGSFSFNGATDYISAPLSIGTDPVVTINQWIKRTTTLNNAGYWGLGGGTVNNGINGYTSVANKIGWDLWGQTTFHTGQDYPLNNWVNVCWVKTAATFTTSTLKIYINGVEYPLVTTVRNNSSTVNLTGGITIGRLTTAVAGYYAPGVVGFTGVYNRALSQTEVQQNFNALRGRYGI